MVLGNDTGFERTILPGYLRGRPEIAGGLVPILLDRILTTTLGQIFWRLDWLFRGTGSPMVGRRTMASILEMPVTQSLILTTTAGIWIEMVSSYRYIYCDLCLGRGV